MECSEPSQHLLIDIGKPRETCVEVAGRRTFRILNYSRQSGIQNKKKQQYTHSTTNTYNNTHTRQLQQYTQDNCNNTHKTTTTIHTRQLQQYTQDNYNNTHKTTTTIHTRQLQQYTQDNYNNTHGQPTETQLKTQQSTQDKLEYNMYKT